MKHNRWTTDEIALAMRMHRQDGLAYAEIARRLDRTAKAVRLKCACEESRQRDSSLMDDTLRKRVAGASEGI